LKKPKIGIVGATGAVGQEILSLLHQREFPFKRIKALASARSVGKELPFGDTAITVEEARPEAFRELDLAIFSAGGDTSRELGPEAVSRDCVVVDNSSAFRMDPTTPLVIPEINPEALENHKGIIANPNCSTAVALMALAPLHERFGLRRFFCSTYQAVSGVGASGPIELEAQVKGCIEGEVPPPEAFPHPIAFNLLPHVDAFRDDGYTKEELKMRNESRKILDLPDLKVSCTCVRVPVFRAHSISINAEFTDPVNIPDAHLAVDEFPGVELRDDPGNLIYPMPIDYSGVEACGVGRMRVDHALDNGLALWVVGDQLWKGAALNAIQISETLLKKDLI
jgi:aspartate-semialdehyde dehydrogenase